MADPFLGEVRILSFGFAPRNWALCNGQFLPIAQNQALFSLLGTMYGGNGQTTFALPNLQGRVPLHAGGVHTQGQSGGEENHNLTLNELPGHSHPALGNSATVNAGSPSGNVWGQKAAAAFSNNLSGLQSMNTNIIGVAGGGQAHNNMSPFLTLNFCIAMQGLYPPRN